MIATGAARAVVAWNRAAETIFGISAADALGQPLEALIFPEEDRAAVIAALDGAPAELAAVARRRDGSLLEVALATRPIEAGAVAVRARPVDARHSDVLSGMSHELRTPLSGIIGFAELIHRGQAGPLTDEQREYLGDIVTASRELLQRITDLVDLARIDAGAIELAPEPVEVAAVVGLVQSLVRGLVARRRLAIDVAIEPEVARIVVDPVRFKQVVYHGLVDATRRAPDDGRIAIRVTAAPGDRVRLEVEHDGPGAPAGKGGGLGLAVTRRIVEAHGGEIELERAASGGLRRIAILPRRPITG